jgi:hypothetical protein
VAVLDGDEDLVLSPEQAEVRPANTRVAMTAADAFGIEPCSGGSLGDGDENRRGVLGSRRRPGQPGERVLRVHELEEADRSRSAINSASYFGRLLFLG